MSEPDVSALCTEENKTKTADLFMDWIDYMFSSEDTREELSTKAHGAQRWLERHEKVHGHTIAASKMRQTIQEAIYRFT